MTGQPKQKTRGRRRWPSLLLLLATIVVVYGLGEITCRLAERMLMGLRWDWRESCIPAWRRTG